MEHNRDATRPVRFSPEVGDRVCMRIAEGRSIRQACLGDGLPTMRTFMRWLATADVADPDRPADEPGPYEALRQHYARAREMRADARFEELDHVLYLARTGKMDAQTARVHLDAIKWQTGKEAPKKYGEKLTLSGDKDNPLQVQNSSPLELSDEQLAMLAAGGIRGAT